MRAWGHHSRSFAALAAAAFLAACQITPASAPAPEPEPVISAESAVLAAYYLRLQDRLLAQGLIRTDGGGPDTPFTDQMLAQNFVRIALFDEYVAHGGTLRAQTTISRLRRWEQPIRMAVEFGASVPRAQRLKDFAAIENFADRLSALTGVQIRQSGYNPNYVVLVLNELDRQGYEARLRELVPGIDDGAIRAVIDLPINVPNLERAAQRGLAHRAEDARGRGGTEVPGRQETLERCSADALLQGDEQVARAEPGAGPREVGAGAAALARDAVALEAARAGVDGAPGVEGALPGDGVQLGLEVREVEIEGQPMFIEATVRVTAQGRPRIAQSQ